VEEDDPTHLPGGGFVDTLIVLDRPRATRIMSRCLAVPVQSQAEAINMTTTPRIDPDLLTILVCPLTRSPLHQEGEELVASVGGLRYPIRNNIPVLLIEEARLPPGVGSIEEFKKKFAQQIPR
jgi:uncharacterized protein YbaR (Trm112 family)